MADLYLRQLLAGRDFARGDAMASGMQNFVYLVGDRDKKECLVVDPAWDIPGILDVAAEGGMKVVGALVTHYHPDHVGGEMFGFEIEGLARLIALNPCKVHCNEHEKDGILFVTGIDKSDVVAHGSGDRVRAGDIDVELLHTPGHTPGSQCFRVAGLSHGEEEALLAGDTLFLQGCGRVDLPGGDAEAMYHTLTQRLAALPGETILLPGHDYGGAKATLAHVRRTNPTLQLTSLQSFMRRMG
jgi:glyoxylase-like metal-dependent hydrolase (beta-lactamase superfamily II)